MNDHLFGPDALPYGVFSVAKGDRRVGVRLRDAVLDLAALAARDAPELAALFEAPSLDRLLASGRPTWDRVREAALRWAAELDAAGDHAAKLPLETVHMHLPFTVGDYVDFFSSRQHVENMSRILRPGQPLLQPNWLRVPVAYHGRSASIVPSGGVITRPWGVLPPVGDADPEFGPTRRLDVEVELGFVVGVGSELGTPIPIADFTEHVFGVVPVNDWSARDIQAFEAVPLGAFLGKSFATGVGLWVTPLAALEFARIPAPPREVGIADYLKSDANWGLNIDFELILNGSVVSRPAFSSMYWTPDQQLAHMTVNGAAANTGDLYASGTVSSGADADFGSLMELSRGGTTTVALDDGTTRQFLEDGDEVVITATARGSNGTTIGLGDVVGTIAGYDHPTSRRA